MKKTTLKANLLAIIAFLGLINLFSSQAQTTTTLGFYDFESGTQGWTESNQGFRNNNGTYAYSGNNSFWLRDNLGNNSTMTSPFFSLGLYDKVDIKFFFTTYSMETGEDFFVEYHDGGVFSNWETVARFVSGSVANKSADFQSTNSVIFYSKTVTLMSTDYTLPILPTGRFRIRCDASNTGDYVMVDDITISGTTYANPTTGPGGVTNNLDLWLKADQVNGTTTAADGSLVSQWIDNGKGNNAEVVVAGQEPVFRNNTVKNMNFNPVIEFENDNNTAYSDMTYITNRDELKGTGGFNTNDMFVVLMPDPTVTTSMIPLDTFTSSDPLAESYAEDVTGFGYGSYTARFNNERLTYCIGTTSEGESVAENGYGRADTNSTNDYNKIQIINIRQNAADTDMELYFNANQVGNETNDISKYATINNGRYWLGRSQYWNGSFDGRIAEVITYNSRKSDANLTQERNRIQSYLAIKYGITLGVNGTSQDYVDSDGDVIWDQSANVGYNYDIAGIGRDDDGELNQKQSRSVNDAVDGFGRIEGILTMGLNDIYNTNSENISTNTETLNDKNYLVWGNNNASLDAAPITVAVDLSSGISGLSTPVSFLGMQRIWKVVETGGDVGSVKVSIPQDAIRNISPPGSYYMFISDTPVFDPTADYRLMQINGSNLEADYDFNGTKYITFGYAPQVEVTRSVYFDGSQDYIDMSNKLNLNPSGFTISAWIKRDAADTGNASIISKRDVAYTEGYDFRIINDNRIQMRWINGTNQNLTSNTSIPDDEWHHVAAIYNGTRVYLYIDGVLDRSANRNAPIDTDESFNIAAAGKNTPTQYFRGNIDEVRIWDTELTQAQLQYIMNQEIQENTGFVNGKVIPSSITKNDVATIPWNALAAYYPMSIYTYTNTEDASGNGNQGALRNLNTVDFQTAPLPYQTANNTDWNLNSTWLNGDVQTIPGAASIVNSDTTVDWNIVETNHNITMDNTSLPTANNSNRVLLSLNVIGNTLSVAGNTATNSGNALTISHYLNLDGKIDLEGESQLIQTIDSDLDVTSSGLLERDQQGTQDLYTYNYWSSPVGVSNTTTNNNNYTIPDVLLDGTNPASPQAINFIINGYNGTSGSPIGIADYWIWKYANLATDYYNWQHVRSTGTMSAGEGFTMKGVSNTNGNIALEQNYVFRGKPNNGDINLTIDNNYDYLVGNPYASALDANTFILNNTNTTGTVYFWEHFGGGSHYVSQYEGGYATYNLSGGIPAMQHDYTTGGTTTGGTPTKTPDRYIPVGQSFFVTGSSSGTINFNNGQRVFEKEGANSVFIRQSNNQPNETVYNDNRLKIRLGFNSVNDTYTRQILVTQDVNATPQVDFGYDGESNDSQVTDMFWDIDDKKFLIQGTNQIDVSTILPLGIITNENGDNSIKIDALENVPNDLEIYIYDNVTDTYFDIRNNPEFTVNLNAGEYLNRFDLRFSNANTLSTQDFEAETSLQYYFANNNETIVINNPEFEIIKSVELFNILGQSIIKYTEIENDSIIELKTSNISTGAYIIEINTENGKLSKKVLVE
ncbi:LamG-like jellyroll fold domain-containing protein [Lacinutrix venerupis]|uniref:MAM protein n=1 Tax=Lacinutrix venerupis TaxID=1486034 RepID=A0AAC9LJL3_9FLAO|nr:LamG-like jellyroll fold domain-containing protein [Lacinutrix venerupis]APX99945.1 MAM protein [Lacinutrix venerupis]